MKKLNSLTRAARRAELQRRKSTSTGSILEALLSLLSPLQREFVTDPHRFKIARCGRRAGKSFADAVYLIYECLKNPNTPCLYVGLTRESAKGAVWGVLMAVLLQLGIKHEALASGPIVKFPNGSFIQLLGADANNARNRIRGRKFKLVVVDEMGFFAEADDLILNTLIPTLADYQGTLCMTSSPGFQLKGLFYEADIGAHRHAWKQWYWTLLDNPHFMKPATDPRFKSLGEQELFHIVTVMYKGDAKHPSFRREFLGEWVKDATSLIYPYTEANLVELPYEMPKQMHAIGVEMGSAAANALVVIRFSEFAREVQFVDSYKAQMGTPDDLGKLLGVYAEKYDSQYIVADTGNYSSNIVDEAMRRYSLRLMPAQKADKTFHQRIMRADIVAGHVKVKKGISLLAEWGTLTRDSLDNELDTQNNQLSNAALHVYKRVYQTHLKSFEPPKSEEQRMIEQIEASVLSEMDDEIY